MKIAKLSIITLLLVASTHLHVSAQEVDQSQKSIITKISATWCPPCGGWGWDFFDVLLEDHEDDVLVISNHYSGDLRNPTASAIEENFKNVGQPSFYLGNQDQNVTSSNTAMRRTSIAERVDAQAALTPTANTGIYTRLDDRMLHVDARTVFFTDADGDYYLNIYVVEDKVIADQASRGNDVEHSAILRTGLDENAFGIELVSGSANQGDAIEMDFDFEIPSDWNIDNMTLASIIWKLEDDGTYTYVNTELFTDWQDLVSATADLSSLGVALQSRPGADGQLLTHITVEQPLTSAVISLLDLQGRVIETQSIDVPSGTSIVRWNKSVHGLGSIGLVHLQSTAGQITEKVALK